MIASSNEHGEELADTKAANANDVTPAETAGLANSSTAARTSAAQTLAQILDEVPVPPAKDKLFV